MKITASLTVFLTSTMVGCATIGERQVDQTSRVIAYHASHVPSDGAPDVTIDQDDNDVLLTVRARCDNLRQDELKITTRYERFNESSNLDYGLAIGGGLLAVGGASVYSKAGKDSTLSPSEAHTAGALGIGLGMVGIGIAVVDAIRASDSDTRYSTTAGETHVYERNVRCTTPTPLPDVAVTLRAGEESVPLGRTDAWGELKVDLGSSVPRSWLVGERPFRKAWVLVNEARTKVLALDAVALGYESRLWAEADRASCGEATRATACDGIDRYLADFPRGQHAEEARALKEASSRAISTLLRQEEEKRLRETRAQEQREAAAVLAQKQSTERDRRAREQKSAQLKECNDKCRIGCNGNSECTSQCVSGC